jgi:hypothetical protein
MRIECQVQPAGPLPACAHSILLYTHAGRASQRGHPAVLAADSADTLPLPARDGEECDSLRRQVAELQQKVDRLESLADGRAAASPAGVEAHLVTPGAKTT